MYYSFARCRSLPERLPRNSKPSLPRKENSTSKKFARVPIFSTLTMSFFTKSSKKWVATLLQLSYPLNIHHLWVFSSCKLQKIHVTVIYYSEIVQTFNYDGYKHCGSFNRWVYAMFMLMFLLCINITVALTRLFDDSQLPSISHTLCLKDKVSRVIGIESSSNHLRWTG